MTMIPSRIYSCRLLFLGILLAVPVSARGQDTGNIVIEAGVDELQGVAVPRPDVLVVAHSCGVMTTENGGVDWAVHNFPDCCGVNDMKFRGNLGFIVEKCRIWRSVDSGRHWETVFSWSGDVAPGEGISLEAITFVDSSTLIAVGLIGAWMRSTDAGATWQSLEYLYSVDLSDVDFYDSRHGIIVTNTGNIHLSHDGGASWKDTVCRFDGETYTSQYSFPPELKGVTYIGRNILIAVSDEGHIFRSTDNGVNWERRWSSPCGNPLQDVEFVDDLHGVAVGDGGIIVQTIDGGLTWSWEIFDPHPAYTRPNLRRVLFIDRNQITAVGDMGVILRRTFDW